MFVIFFPRHRYKPSNGLSPEDLARLIDTCVARLSRTDDPGLETIKLQFAFDQVNREELKDRERDAEAKRLKIEDTLAEILEGQGRGEAMLQALYRNMVGLMAIQAGIGNASDPVVERETAQALLSVFPRAELKPFVALPAADKAKRLGDLSDIVLGIRLYNRATGKGGRDIDDIPSLAFIEARQNEMEAEAALDAAAKLCSGYVEVISKDRVTRPPGFAERVARLTEELNNRRQLCAYLERVLQDIRLVKEEADRWRAKYERELSQLKALVGAKQAVLKDQVYPKFIAVARVWKTLTDLVREDRAQFRVLRVLLASSGAYTTSVTETEIRDAEEYARERQKAEFEGRVTQFDRQRAAAANGVSLAAAAQAAAAAQGTADTSPAVRVFYEATAEFMQLPIEFKGFCAYSMVHSDGLLLLGDSSLGLVGYRGKYYAFVDEPALLAFMHTPDRYIADVLNVARRQPQLIYLIGVQDRIRVDPEDLRPDYAPAVLKGVHRQSRLGPPTVEVACETPLHFVESYIDPKYNWNEWAMRKQALTLYNLKDKLTRSQQTSLSHFRREGETQHYAPKPAETQTRVSEGTTVPRTSHYLSGLRGHPHDKAKLTTLIIE